MTLMYNAPIKGNPSTVDQATQNQQMQSFFWLRKAIITERKEQYFTQLSNVTNMPKHFGKTIKVMEYVPLLDSRNINTEGIDANGVAIANGNLYGSSRDFGTIIGKLPILSETGGRVNRVGFTRIMREASLHKLGFFYEFTAESLNFDSDPQLKEHLARELMSGAVQISEAVLQSDLLTQAGVHFYNSAVSSITQVSGEVTNNITPSGLVVIPPCVIDYRGLMRIDQMLTDNRCPKKTTIITGSRMTDTKVIGAARVLYVGSEVVPLLRTMKDPFNNAAFIPVQHYAAAAGTTLEGEIGSIDGFRIVQVPEMQYYKAAGALVTDPNTGYRSEQNAANEEHYNVYPMMVVGDDSFTTIGFQVDSNDGKFTVKTKMPDKDITTDDPYAETGLSSIKWYYGTLVKRPERIAVIYTVAPI